MKTDEIMKYVIIGLGLLCVAYFVLKLTNLQLNIVEGLTNNNTFASSSEFIYKAIGKENDKAKDAMLLKKYKDNYEKIIINLEEWCNLQMLGLVFSNNLDITTGMSDKNIQLINKLNECRDFKQNLNDCMEYLQTGSSVGGGGDDDSNGKEKKSGSFW